MSNELSEKSETQEKQSPESEELDFTKPDFEFVPKGIHDWRQQGYFLVCKGCEIEHAVWIGDKKLMVGIDKKGVPILKTRKELGMV